MSERHAPTSHASAELRRLATLPDRDLAALLARGERPDADALCGWQYRGANTPAWARAVGVQKFVKGFYRDGATGEAHGYNIPVRQDGLDRPWALVPDATRPKRFGFYRVAPVDAAGRDNAHLNALLLDYGAVPGRPIDPARVLRDYVVRVERGADELLLGRAYARVGPIVVPASWFLLERLAPTDWSR